MSGLKSSNLEAYEQLRFFFDVMTPWKGDKISHQIAKYLDGEIDSIPFQDKIDGFVAFSNKRTQQQMKKYGFFWLNDTEYWFSLEEDGRCNLQLQENNSRGRYIFNVTYNFFSPCKPNIKGLGAKKYKNTILDLIAHLDKSYKDHNYAFENNLIDDQLNDIQANN
jgi:hypothetical protein